MRERGRESIMAQIICEGQNDQGKGIPKVTVNINWIIDYLCFSLLQIADGLLGTILLFAAVVTKPDLSLTMQPVTPQQQQTDPSKKSILKQMTLVLEFLLLACKIDKFGLPIYKYRLISEGLFCFTFINTGA